MVFRAIELQGQKNKNQQQMPRQLTEQLSEDSARKRMRKISRTDTEEAARVRKSSNPEYSTNNDAYRDRERSNTLPNTPRNKQLRVSVLARREANNSDDSLGGGYHSPSSSGHLSSTTTGSDFRSRSNTLPAKPAVGSIGLLTKYRAGQQSAQHSSNDSLHSPKNGSSRDLTKVGQVKQTTIPEGKKQQSTVNRRRPPHDKSPLSAGDILDTHIQKAFTIRKREQLPTGSDIFEELRGELFENMGETDIRSSCKVKVEVEDDYRENAPSKWASNSKQNGQIALPRSALSDNIAKSCSAPNSPAMTRRVHFKGVP